MAEPIPATWLDRTAEALGRLVSGLHRQWGRRIVRRDPCDQIFYHATPAGWGAVGFEFGHEVEVFDLPQVVIVLRQPSHR